MPKPQRSLIDEAIERFLEFPPAQVQPGSKVVDQAILQQLQGQRRLYNPECFLLTRANEDIRNLIWRELLHRPCGIVPDYSNLPKKRTSYGQKKGNRYEFQWEEEYWGRNKLTDATYVVTTISKPTFEEREILETDVKSGVKISRTAHRRHNGEYQVFSNRKVNVLKFDGLSILRTCNQIKSEASKILYGTNRFVFRERAQILAYPWEDFGNLPDLTPGAPNYNGMLPTEEQVLESIKRYPGSIDDSSFRRDPLLCFLDQIGLENASQILKITIEGELRDWRRTRGLPEPEPSLPRVGFAGILSMHTLVLKTLCPSLRSLTLHMAGGTSVDRAYKWDYDVDQSKANEEKYDETVAKVVEGLPNLQHLQLGNYRFGRDPLPQGNINRFRRRYGWRFRIFRDPNYQKLNGPDEWGKSVRWMGIVTARPEKPRSLDPDYIVLPSVGQLCHGKKEYSCWR